MGVHVPAEHEPIPATRVEQRLLGIEGKLVDPEAMAGPVRADPFGAIPENVGGGMFRGPSHEW